MSELGPLAALEGEWEGNVGLDVSFHYDDEEVDETTYFEKAWFRRIPVVNSGSQSMHGLNYEMTAWRHGEEDMDPFHDEVGYFLWEEATGRIMRCFAVPRGLSLLAGGTASAQDRVLDFRAESGSTTFGIVQNPYLLDRARSVTYDATFTFNDDGTLSYTSDLVLDLAAMGAEMHHTDRNTLHRTDR